MKQYHEPYKKVLQKYIYMHHINKWLQQMVCKQDIYINLLFLRILK